MLCSVSLGLLAIPFKLHALYGLIWRSYSESFGDGELEV